MKNMLRLTVALTALLFSLPSLRAEDAAPAAQAAEPELTISLPAGLKAEDVVSAANKAFTEANWIGIAVQNSTVVAFIDHHHVKVKATAVCTASEIKVFTDYQGAGRVTPKDAKANVDRWLRIFEHNTRKELGLLPTKGEKSKKAN